MLSVLACIGAFATEQQRCQWHIKRVCENSAGG